MELNFTKRIQDEYKVIRNKMEKRYNEILTNIIDLQLSNEKIGEIVEQEIKSFKIHEGTRKHLYLKLKLEELFKIGKEEGLWTVDNDGNIINFGLDTYIIQKDRIIESKTKKSVYMYEVFDKFFKEDKLIKELEKRISELFPDANIGEGHCRFYEKSKYIEYYIGVTVPLYYP